MHIQFSPALGEALQVSASRGDAPIVLNFTATLSTEDHDVLSRDGAKVQLWSDIPLNAKWSELDFQDVKPLDVAEAAWSSTQTVVSLCRPANIGDKAQDLQQGCALSLKLFVPRVNDGQPHQYSFTYRLAYPSGEIRWLGQFGENGIIVIDSQNHPDMILGEEWTRSNTGYEWNTGGRAVDGLEAARLATPSDYVAWAIGKEESFGPTNASLVFFVPRTRSPSAVTNLTLTYAISATPDLTIDVLSSGVITTSGVGSLTLHTYDVRQLDAGEFVEHILSICSLDNRRCVALSEGSSHGVLTLPNTGLPVKVALVPIAPRLQHHAYHRVRIGLGALAALLPDIRSYSVSSPLNPDIQFFTAETGAKGNVIFVVDPSGGEFTLSPAFDLADRKLQVSILSPHSFVKTSPQEEADILPTPPPSPRLEPIARPSPSRESTISTIAPLSDTGEESLKVKPKSAPVVTLRPPLNIRYPLLSGLRALKFIFTVTAVWFVLLYRLLFRRPKADPISDGGYTDGEATTLTPDEAAGSTESYDTHDEAEVVPIITEPKTREDDMIYMDTSPASSPSSEQLVELKGGLVRIAARSVSGAPLVEHIVVEVNGDKQVPSSTKFEGSIYLLNFDVDDGGLMRLDYS